MLSVSWPQEHQLLYFNKISMPHIWWTYVNCLPDQVSMELNVQCLAVPLSAELLHGGAGGAEHQLQVCLGSRGGLRARGCLLRIHCATVQTHTAPLGVSFKPVPLTRPEPGLPRHAAPTPVSLDVALLRQKVLFQCTFQCMQQPLSAGKKLSRHDEWHMGRGGGSCRQHTWFM